MAEELDETAKAAHAVFLYDVIEVNRSISAVWARLCDDGAWLAPLAERATDRGDRLLKVGPGRGSLSSREVKIRVGRCSYRDGISYIPIRWEATRLSRLFPILDGTLELSLLEGERCCLAMKASYRPPLEGLGRVIDSALMHRVAAATVRSFLREVAQSFETQGELTP